MFPPNALTKHLCRKHKLYYPCTSHSHPISFIFPSTVFIWQKPFEDVWQACHCWMETYGDLAFTTCLIDCWLVLVFFLPYLRIISCKYGCWQILMDLLCAETCCICNSNVYIVCTFASTYTYWSPSYKLTKDCQTVCKCANICLALSILWAGITLSAGAH